MSTRIVRYDAFKLKDLVKVQGGATLLHHAAEEGKLNQIPVQSLEEDHLCIQDIFGYTLLHYAVLQGQSDLIPRKLLTAKTVSIQDNSGYTPLHFLAVEKDLSEIDRDWLRLEALTNRSHPFHGFKSPLMIFGLCDSYGKATVSSGKEVEYSKKVRRIAFAIIKNREQEELERRIKIEHHKYLENPDVLEDVSKVVLEIQADLEAKSQKLRDAIKGLGSK